MRKIEKLDECKEVAQWKKKNPTGKYSEIDDLTRRAIRTCLLTEQYGLCAYCCQIISSIDDCHNEHLKPQATHNAETLAHTNMVASCNAKRQCGDAHSSRNLPITPLMDECETELVFKLSGRVEGTSDRGRETIRVLNLGDKNDTNKALVAKRKQLCDALLWTRCGNGFDDLCHEDTDLLRIIIEDISEPKGNKLDSFSPVLANMLKQYLNN